MFQEIIQTIVTTVGAWGYPGIFLMMALESSFFPFPSEVVMIPAGYLAYTGEMNLLLAILSGIGGSLVGALFNYWLACKFGRPFLLRYGKYILFKEHSLQRMEDFFARHGHMSTFTGRLIPVIRQYISLPAGLARMNLAVFSFYTALGAGIWVTVLALLGYSLGHNEAAIRENLHLVTLVTLGAAAVIILLYARLKLKKKIVR